MSHHPHDSGRRDRRKQVEDALKAADVKVVSFEITEFKGYDHGKSYAATATGVINLEGPGGNDHVWLLGDYEGYSTGTCINSFYHNRQKNQAIKAYIRLKVGEKLWLFASEKQEEKCRAAQKSRHNAGHGSSDAGFWPLHGTGHP
jgi:hypothetical protein